MTVPQSTTTADSPLWRDGLRIARYYLSNRWVLVALGGVALVTGIALNWGWLVAAGVAPILLSTLPCLVMCALGFCMACRSGNQQTDASKEPADAATSSAALPLTAMDKGAADAAARCHEQAGATQPRQLERTNDERADSHA
jgi:hypothetical protein